MILVVTNKQDFTADYFILRAKEKGVEIFRFNTEDYPIDIDISYSISGKNKVTGYIESGDRLLDISKIQGIWFRRPRPSRISNTVEEEEIRRFCLNECTVSIDGILKSLECNWVSHPDKIRAAENKVYQLNIAKSIGFKLPETLLTNKKSEIEKFLKTKCNGKKAIIKPISRGYIDDEKARYLMYTSIFEEPSGEYLENAKVTSNLIQEYIDNKSDIRINVIGSEVFATEIQAPEGHETYVDWRKHQDSAVYREHFIPDGIRDKCCRLVTKLGLSFGAIDMVLDAEGRYYFLEINPNGQWAWIEQVTGVKLFESLVKALLGNEYS